jgi:hypothetical protein
LEQLAVAESTWVEEYKAEGKALVFPLPVGRTGTSSRGVERGAVEVWATGATHRSPVQ